MHPKLGQACEKVSLNTDSFLKKKSVCFASEPSWAEEQELAVAEATKCPPWTLALSPYALLRSEEREQWFGLGFHGLEQQ